MVYLNSYCIYDMDDELHLTEYGMLFILCVCYNCNAVNYVSSRVPEESVILRA